MSEYHSALEYHSAFDGINNAFADTRNDTKNAKDDGIEASRCYCDVSALGYHAAFDSINNVFADTRNDTKNAKDDGIGTSICYCGVKILHRQPLFYYFLRLGTCTGSPQNHRPEERKQAKELAKFAKAREQKACIGARVAMVSSAFEPHESEAKCPPNIWRDFKAYLSEIGLLLATLEAIIYIYSYTF